jgi:hypothetical protein
VLPVVEYRSRLSLDNERKKPRKAVHVHECRLKEVALLVGLDLAAALLNHLGVLLCYSDQVAQPACKTTPPWLATTHKACRKRCG